MSFEKNSQNSVSTKRNPDSFKNSQFCTNYSIRKYGESPLGELEGGYLVRHTTYNCNNFVLIKDLQEINRQTKHANRRALDYVLNDLTSSIRRKLTENLLTDQENRTLQDFVDNNRRAELFYNGNFDELKDIPLNVIERFNQSVTNVRNESLLTYAENRFTDYIKNLKKYRRYVHVHRGENQSTFIPMETRYSDGYRKKIHRRMKGLSYQYRGAQSVLLTLTLNPELYGYDKIRMWEEIRIEIHNFLTKLKQYLNARGRELPPYLCTIEGMKQPRSCGNPHAHLVFVGAHRLLDYRVIRKLWGKGHIGINRSWKGERIRNPVMYASKYITKTYANTTAENVLTQSLLWLFNVRSFSCSRGLVLPLKPKSLGDWTADYIAICSPHETLIDDVESIEERLHSGYAGYVPPPITNHALHEGVN